MIRLFEQHQIRKVKELEGLWDFSVPGKNKKYRLPVPGCWEQHPELLTYRGQGIYFKSIDIKEKNNVRLVMQGVSHTADVFFDGKKIAHHYNAFTPFSTLIKEVTEGEYELKIEVDNSFGEHSALHMPNDYYTYGGITRPISIEYLGDVFVEGVHFTPTLKDGIWSAKIEITVRNLSSEVKAVSVKSQLANVHMLEEVLIDADSTKTIIFQQDFDGVCPWSPEKPELYLLKTIIMQNGKETDDLIERVGFRTITCANGKLLLNGRPIYLKGFNRHEDYAVDGCAVSLQHMVQDLSLMQDMNANAVRTCHYPNDERFLDLCDEQGIMVWEENHARGLSLERMLNPNFEKQCEACIREMVEEHYNHPSIIIWGILNECASETEEGRLMYAKQYEQLRNLDTTRPRTSATCKHHEDICLDLPDIVSYNIYSGWYEDCSTQERNDKEIEWIRNAGGLGKPIIVSEFGGGAIYGFRDPSHCKWSEERQADILQDNMEVYMNNENIVGVFVWQFADCRVTEEEWFSTRAKCHNNKGVVDEYRRPKLAYNIVKEYFGK